MGKNENILGNMLRRSTFYELDVLERIRQRVKARAKAAIAPPVFRIFAPSSGKRGFCLLGGESTPLVGEVGATSPSAVIKAYGALVIATNATKPRGNI